MQEFFRTTMQTDPTTEAVQRGVLNALAVTAGAGKVVVATGIGLVYGLWYKNDAALDVSVPTPVSATRIDRIILRASMDAGVQTVRAVRLAGTEGAGVPPTLTQNATTWEVSLATISITTGGTITVTADERVYCRAPGSIGTDNSTLEVSAGLARIKDDGVTAAKIATDAVTSDAIAANAVTATELNDNAVTTPKILDGQVTAAKMASNSVATANIVNGNVTNAKLASDAVATANIQNSAVSGAKIAGDAITTDKIAAGAVGTTDLANDAVDDTKAGNRVPQFYRRQGGDATDWDTPGTTTRTPTTVRMEAGEVSITPSIVGGAAPYQFAGAVTITFPTAFSAKPLVFVTVGDTTLIGVIGSHALAYDTTASQVYVGLAGTLNDNTAGTMRLRWLAIGPE